MKIVPITVGILVALMIGVVVSGTLLPKHNSVTRTQLSGRNRPELFALVSGRPTWRPDVDGLSTSLPSITTSDFESI
jgi:hypothetical protein